MGDIVTDHRKWAVGFAAVALATAAGCGSSSKPNPLLNQPAPLTTSPSATPTASESSSSAASTSAPTKADPTAEANSQALDAYKHMITALTKTMDTNQIAPDLAEYSSGGAYVTFNQAVANDIKNNLIYKGVPQSSPKVTATDLSASPNVVTILDCFAGPSFKPVFIADDKAGHKKGESGVAPGHSTEPHPLTVQVVNRAGVWKVDMYKIDSSKPC